MLIFPGPGDVEISLPPGSLRVPLEKAPSGHLVMVIDEYQKLIAHTGGVAGKVTHLLSGSTPATPDTGPAAPVPSEQLTGTPASSSSGPPPTEESSRHFDR